LPLSKAAWETLQNWTADGGEQDLDEDTFLERLKKDLLSLGKQQFKALIDAAAVPAYHAETEWLSP
jgi:hypothetical protein